jgi:hypothetical protein
MLRVGVNRATLLLAIGIVTPLGILMVNLAAFVMAHLEQFRLLIAACALISSLVLNTLAVTWLTGIARRRSYRFYVEYPEIVRAVAAIAVVGGAALAAYFTYVGMRDPRQLPNLLAILASVLALLIPFGVALLGRLVVRGGRPI